MKRRWFVSLSLISVFVLQAMALKVNVVKSRGEIGQFLDTLEAKCVFIAGKNSDGGSLHFIDISQPEEKPVVKTITQVSGAKLPEISPDGKMVTYVTGAGGEHGSPISQTATVWVCELKEDAAPVKVAELGYEPRWKQVSDVPTIIYPTIATNRQWKEPNGKTMQVEITLGSDGTISVGTPSVLVDAAYTGGLSYDGKYICGGGGNAGLFNISEGGDPQKPDTIVDFGQTCNVSVSSHRENTGYFMNLCTQVRGSDNADLPDNVQFGTWQAIFITQPAALGSNSGDKVMRYYPYPVLDRDSLINSASQLHAIRTPQHSEKWHHCEWSNHPDFAVATLNVVRAYVENPAGYYDKTGFGDLVGIQNSEFQERIFLINLRDESNYLEIIRMDSSEVNHEQTIDLRWPGLWVSSETLPVKNQLHSSFKASTIHLYADAALISSSQGKITNVSVHNALGQEMFSQKFHNSLVKVSALKTLPSGVYFVKVMNEFNNQVVLRHTMK